VQLDFDDYDFLEKIYLYLSNVDYARLWWIDHDHEYFQQHHVVEQYVIDVVDDVVAKLLVVVPIVHEQLQDFQQIDHEVYSRHHRHHHLLVDDNVQVACQLI
jgi:hypothetical protein